MKEGVTLKSLTCPDRCSFMVCSRDAKGITDAVISHAKKHHNMTLTEVEVKANVKVVAEKREKK